MIQPKFKVPSLEHYIMKIVKLRQENIFARAKSEYIRLCKLQERTKSEYPPDFLPDI